MAGRLRKASLYLLALVLLACLVSSVVWWSIRTAWFANSVRARLVTSLQEATGGKVELGRFTFDPATLNATAERLVVHGTEPAGSRPLLAIESIEIRLKILSLWRRDIDVQSIVLNRPEVQLLIREDGSTNIPAPKRRSQKSAVEQILDLKVARMAVTNGTIRVADRKLPLQFVSQDLALLLNYSFDGPHYGAVLQTDVISSLQPMHIDVNARLYRDAAEVDSFHLATGKGSSTILFSGRVAHFAQPAAEGKIDASVSIDELARSGDLSNSLRGGRAKLSGGIHYDTGSAGFRFEGNARVESVDFVSPKFTLRNISANSDVVASNAGMLLHHVEAAARGAHFSGEGSIKDYERLALDGTVWQVALREVGSYLTKKPFPWSGTAHGTAHAAARLRKQSELVITARVEIDRGTYGVPTAGSVDVAYYARNGKVEFGNSNLQLPHTAITLQGSLNEDLNLQADSSDLSDVAAVLPILDADVDPSDLPRFTAGGSGHFAGVLHNLSGTTATTQGNVSASRFRFRNFDWDALSGQFSYSVHELQVSKFQLSGAGARLAGNGVAQLVNGLINRNSPLHLRTQFSNLNVVRTAALFSKATLPIQGVASGHVDLQGTINAPRGSGSFEITNLDAYGEQLNQISFDAALDGQRVQVNKGRVQSGPAMLTFSGDYQHSMSDWTAGEMVLQADTNGFPLSSLTTVRRFLPALNANAELHLKAEGRFSGVNLEPAKINGNAEFRRVTLGGRELGHLSLHARTHGPVIGFDYTGDLRETKFRGAAEARLSSGTPIRGDIQMERLNLATLKALLTQTDLVLPLNGFLEGTVTFDGLLQEPQRMHAQATVKQLQVSSTPRAAVNAAAPPDIVLSNNQPIVIDVSDGALHITRFEVDGRDTSVKVTGTASLLGSQTVDIKAVGKADLALFMLFDPNVRSAGSSEIAVNISGNLAEPNVTGTLAVNNGSFFLPDLPNGLSDLNGSVIFGRNRATIQKMSAHSGGGDISLAGTLSFGAGTPLVYHLEAAARNVRVRYANSISVTANSDLRLSGTSASSILSGTMTATRVVFTSNADAGSLLAAASLSTSAPADQGDFISGLHLDINVDSAPNLQVSTNLSRDVEAEIQLSLRGTPEHPILLGSITANQGDIKIFGTRFSLNRGEVTFVNTVRIEPVLDLDLETQARGVTVDITVSGAPSKLNFNYRSDPPLQPRDIIALLTVGRAPDLGTTNNAQSGSDVSALKSGVNSVLGQAISPVSNRLSKLFGITNIKIDPFVQGITNTPQARLSVEQQISRDVTITYVTNLSQTSEQIFRFEWALSRQFSIVALRDDNGEFGIDFQYKKRFK